ncbi:type III secretion system protein SctP [Paraburkholderia sediminicola]|uniref:type III secretion system protein SctP n=1 Tax=Paraburkholderia sediminicola TaxID=458836 RepID=UPI0038BD5A94
MHSSATHRVHVIAGPEPAREPARAHPDTPELRRLAALFNAHRDAACRADDQEADQEGASGTVNETKQTDAPEHEPARAAAEMPPTDTAAQGDAPLAGLPYAPAWQKPDQNSGGGADNNSGQHGGDSGGQNPSSAQSERRSGLPSTSTAHADLIAALRSATTTPACPGKPTPTPASAAAPTLPQAPQPAHPAQAPQPRHARVEAAPAALTVGALSTAPQSNPLVESIVSSVADFCANPAVFSCSPWHLTVPLDPALLPGCQLTLMLSHFVLTLRFTTTEPASHDLISQHADALRRNLESLPSLHQDTPRAIEIVVT